MQSLCKLLLAFALIFQLFGCAIQEENEAREGHDKCEPYDLFSFQRSYPDTVFDWRGWRSALTAVRQNMAAQSRMPGCGDEYIPQWTVQGPGNAGGRCNTLAAKPDDEDVVLAGFSAGGIFKSKDGGVNWTPVFDEQSELSIADITFDPVNNNIVYAGTGDPNIPSIPFNGNGIYKSTDAGDHWSYLGLSAQGIISKVVVNSDNPDILLAAAMGNPYKRSHDRGVYRSADGGVTWQQVLFVSDQAGASDLVMSPANPNILYASFWDRIRSNTESIAWGTNARVFKSTDGGLTWQQLGNGLPTGVMGRTGLAISRQNPDKLYVVYIDSLSTPGGLYKTTDGGNSWTSLNINSLEDACADFGWYFGKIRLNPDNDEDLYFLAILLWRKPAGSNSWLSAGGGHSDCHDLIFTASGRRYWANDGGVYRNDPGQMFWSKSKNLPVTQFYHVSYNPHEPDNYWGGAQDNGIQKGHGGAMYNSWQLVFSADGFHCAFHPTDPETFWVEIQNGTVHKTTDGGNSWQFGSTALGTSDRISWDAPLFISKFSPYKLYSATYRAYVSNGNGWSAISGDLTDTGFTDEARFHTVTCMDESPVLAEKLVAGTSDGNVWYRNPASGWFKINGALPDRYVTSVHFSPTLPNRLFVTHSGFRDDEYIPHIHRSDNNGANWVDISGDLPQVPVNDLLVLPGHADSVLFAATDAGVYFSRNFGTNWTRLGNNMPIIPVFDLEENIARKELMAATYARGIWTMPLDSIFSQQNSVMVNIAGAIHTETGDGVGNVQVGLQHTNASGVYTLTSPGCNSMEVAPYRNDNIINGLTTYDLVLINKHILGIKVLDSPYKIIAADANQSNSISTYDIVLFRKLILGTATTLPNNTSWRFIPESFAFSNPVNPFSDSIPATIDLALNAAPVSGVNFIAVKVGDVNNSAIPNAIAPAEARAQERWSFGLDDREFRQNEPFEVAFKGAPGMLAGMQFTLKFDPKILSAVQLTPLGDGVSSDNFNMSQFEKGVLTCSFEREAPEYFSIRFKALKPGRLRESLFLTSAPTPSLAFRDDGTPVALQLWGDAGQIALAQAAPNPFGNAGVWLNFGNGDRGLSGTLDIFDTAGRLIYSEAIDGKSAIHLAGSNFPAPGVYFWQVKSSEQCGKLIFSP